MLPAAGLGALALVLVAVVLPPRLAAARWPVRAPVPALVLWQALGLAGGLLVLVVAATVALVPYGPTHADAVQRLVAAPVAPPWWAALAALVGLGALVRLLSALAVSAVRTLRARQRHRRLLDLVSTRNPLVRGARVVEHPVPVAYCLPGLRPRVVVSQGALLCLSAPEVQAVLAHEEAHLLQRHDLVVLPFAALVDTAPRLPGVRTAAGEVALLVELLADDSASRRHDRTALARALYAVGHGPTPAGGLAAAGTGVLLRAERLLDPPAPLPWTSAAVVVALAVGVLALPLLPVAVPLLR